MNRLTLNTGDESIELIDRKALRTIVSGTQTIELNATDKCTIKVRSAEMLHIPIGATCVIFGRFYRMNYLPRVEKLESRLFETDIELEGAQYDLLRAIYDLTIDTTNNQLQDVNGDALIGDLERFATVLVANANRVFPGGWRLGECPTTAKDVTLTFGETDNCLLVLQRLCQEFKTEFEVVMDGSVFVLNFRKVGRVLPFRFEFGQGKGVYKLERQNVSQANIVTRLKIQGASKNLPSKYRSSRLCLPGKNKNLSFLEDPIKVDKYGLFESRKFFDDIFPSRTGKVTSVKNNDVLQFVDDAMFDLNEKDGNGAFKYRLPGTAAKIHFNSGNLAGYEFDIVSYDHATHTFKIKAITDDNQYTFPSKTSSDFQFSVGDEYKLLQITLPQSYIDEAERRLKEEAEKLYAQKSQPEVTYALTLEELFIRKLYGQASGTILNVGDYVQVKDDDLMVDKSLRIAGFTRDLINEYKYNLTISEAPVSSSLISRIVEGLAEIDRVLTVNDLKNTARSKRNWRDTQELLHLIFDPDGYFLTEKIKPLSIETSMLSVGAKSAQLMLNGVVIEPNSGGIPNHVSVTSGTLDHLTVSDSIRSWSIHGGATVINDDEAHYIYARCAKDGNVGTIIFDKRRLKPEDEVGYYNFLIGVLHSVRDNVRGISLTYGSSAINGRFITTGVIQSNDGHSLFDLDNNVFQVGDNRSGLSWNINGDRILRIKGGAIVQSQGGYEDYMPYDRGSYIEGMTVHPYDMVSYNGYKWLWRGDAPTTSLPGSLSEWERRDEVSKSSYSVILSSYERIIKEGGEGLRQELKVTTGDRQVTAQGEEVVTSQYSLSTHITSLRGDKELLYSETAGEGTYSVALNAHGITASVSAGNIIVTSVGEHGGHVDIEVNCEGKTIIAKRFSVVVVADGIGKYVETRYMYLNYKPSKPIGRNPEGWSKTPISPRETISESSLRHFVRQNSSYLLDLISTDFGSLTIRSSEGVQFVAYRAEGYCHKVGGISLRVTDSEDKEIYKTRLTGHFSEYIRFAVPPTPVVLSVYGVAKSVYDDEYSTLRLTRIDSDRCWESRAEITPSVHDIEGATKVPTWSEPTIYKEVVTRGHLTPKSVVASRTMTGNYSPASFLVRNVDEIGRDVNTSMILYTSTDGSAWQRKRVYKGVSEATISITAEARYYKVRSYNWVDDSVGYSSAYLDESVCIIVSDGKNGIDGDNGRAPRISVDGYWEYWDGGRWVKTDTKAQGRDGADGRVGAMPRYRGMYKSGETYVYDDKYRDIVLYTIGGETIPYAVKSYGASVASPPTTGGGAYWEVFNKFSLVAMDTALVDNANIANFIFKSGKMISHRGLYEGREVGIEEVPSGKAGAFTPNIMLDGTRGELAIRGSVATPFVWEGAARDTIVVTPSNYGGHNGAFFTLNSYDNGKVVRVHNTHGKALRLRINLFVQDKQGVELVELVVPPGCMLMGVVAPDVHQLMTYPSSTYTEYVGGVSMTVKYRVGLYPIAPVQDTGERTSVGNIRIFSVLPTIERKPIGIVAAGRVDGAGRVEKSIGAFKSVSRYGTGKYTVYHSIGHDNYVPTVTASGEGSTLIGMVKAATSSYFEVEIVDDAGRYENGGFLFQCVAE